MVFRHLAGAFLTDASTGAMSPAVVRAIPDEVDRVDAARRQFDLPTHQSTPTARLPFAALLPFDEMMATIEDAFVQNPDAEIRIAAATAIIQSGAYHAERMDSILAFCAKRLREQDPWRLQMFKALADLPPVCWARATDPVPTLTALYQAAYEAKDISQTTLAKAQRLLWRLFLCPREEVVGFAEASLPVHMKRQGTLLNTERDVLAGLPPATAARLLTCLRPYLKDQACGSSPVVPTMVWHSLGETHQRRLAPVMRDIFEIAFKSRNASMAQWGFRELATHFPQEAVSRLPDMLKAEPDWVCVPAVRRLLCSEVQGPLLDTYLQPLPTLRGRFQKEDAGFKRQQFVITFDRTCLYRWSSAQQHCYARTLIHSLVNTSAKDVWFLQFAFISSIGFLPSASLNDGLAPIVAAENPQLAEQRRALIALGDMHDQASLDELLRALDDSRLRDALGPLMKRLRVLPPEQVVALLQPALRSPQITVQKEVVRYLGDLAEPCALDCLLAFMKERGDTLHRDVLIALLRGFWSFLWNASVWTVLEGSIASGRAATCVALCALPNEALGRAWQRARYTRLLTTILHTQSDGNAQQHVLDRLARCLPESFTRETFDALIPYVARVDEPEKIRSALRCLFVFPSTAVSQDELATTLATVQDPRAVQVIVQFLTTQLSTVPRIEVASLAALGDLLRQTLVDARRQLTLCARLLVFCQPARAWLTAMEPMLADTQLWHAGVQSALLRCVDSVPTTTGLPLSSVSDLALVEQRSWRTHSSAAVRRLGLSTLVVCSASQGWTSESLAALQTYKADTDAYVREQAELIEVPT